MKKFSYLTALLIFVSVFCLHHPHAAWAVGGGGENMAAEEMGSEMGEISKESEEEEDMESMDQSAPEGEDLVTDEADQPKK